MAEKKQTLEESFASLDEVLAKMEQAELSLEDSFKYYQEGMKLIKGCNDKIDKVEKKLKILNEEKEA